VQIGACDPDGPEAQALLAELSDALTAMTGSSGRASFSSDDARVPRSLFVVARDDGGALLGCGALRPVDGEAAEIKRMYARPGTRAVGAALLAHLEQAARGFGYRELWLETRVVNERAVQFYLKHGYARIPNYGKYAGRADAACFRKPIG
jgi:GNAT superfamily N-acetyltransferase